ncbi:MAG: rod shape-determining protein MreC [Treponema sp.]|jgi:rod shape-determining protein MreC|nr:rod shape-determining protein MreC [Treponema sp.]
MKKRGGWTPKNRLPIELYVFSALMVISFALLLISTRTVIMNLRDAGLSVFSGVRGRVDDVSSLASRTVLSVRELAKLRTEYAELLERVTRYERLERSAAEISQENLRLKEQLSFSQSLDYRHIPAKLIGRDPDNLYSALVINKGSHSGVARDMAVIAWQGGAQALVGKVIQVRTFESLVMPLYDSSLLIASRFAASRYEGIAGGQGNPDLPLRMRFIPKRARDEISRGDLVVSSGMGGIYPPEVNIGRISDIFYHEYEISMEAELEPLIDFSRLEYVFVVEEKGASSVENVFLMEQQ